MGRTMRILDCCRVRHRIGACLFVACCATFAAAEQHEDHHHDQHAAADHQHDPAHDGGHAHEVTLHGRPRINYFGEKTEFLWWSPQLFLWTLGLFLALWYVLSRLVWRPMLQAFEERDQRIQETFALAEKLREEARSIADTMDVEIVEAQQAARALLDQARSDAATEVSQIVAKAKQDQAESLAAARDGIERAAKQGLQAIESSAASLAQQIADQLAGRPLEGRSGRRS